MVQALLAQVKKETVIITGGSRRAILHCFFVESCNHPRPFYTFKGKVSGTEIIYERKFKCEKDVVMAGREKERDGLRGGVTRRKEDFSPVQSSEIIVAFESEDTYCRWIRYSSGTKGYPNVFGLVSKRN